MDSRPRVRRRVAIQATRVRRRRCGGNPPVDLVRRVSPLWPTPRVRATAARQELLAGEATPIRCFALATDAQHRARVWRYPLDRFRRPDLAPRPIEGARARGAMLSSLNPARRQTLVEVRADLSAEFLRRNRLGREDHDAGDVNVDKWRSDSGGERFDKGQLARRMLQGVRLTSRLDACGSIVSLGAKHRRGMCAAIGQFMSRGNQVEGFLPHARTGCSPVGSRNELIDVRPQPWSDRGVASESRCEVPRGMRASKAR